MYRLQVFFLNGKPVQMKLNTGATVSVISKREWKNQFSYINELKEYIGKPLCDLGKQLDIAG